jgi:hypothetical protein
MIISVCYTFLEEFGRMNILATNPIKHIKEKSSLVSKISNIINNLGFITEKDKDFTVLDHIYYMLKASESSDAVSRSNIENHIVKIGENAVPALIKYLLDSKGVNRGLAAMALIRIGEVSIYHLKKMAEKTPEMNWVSEYIISEIQGSGCKINTQKCFDNKKEEVLAS